ncbi:MAG TPA: helix-turn-helix domain-containing protein [Verrucomicrobiae bacterium]|jgi:transcriptional regulator with XRE-family HTH domain
MAEPTSVAARFRQFRERDGLSENEASRQMGISPSCLWDIESFEGDLLQGYSPIELRKFCRVLGIHPNELFGVENKEPPVSAPELVRLIQEQCELRGMTLEQFEDVVGWQLSAGIESPEKLLEGMTIDGLQWLCKELGVDWHRVI